LAVTGYPLRQEGLEQLKEIGFVDVLSKPFDVKRVIQVLKAAIPSRW
jgi:CheY-like chemotaxis protein